MSGKVVYSDRTSRTFAPFGRLRSNRFFIYIAFASGLQNTSPLSSPIKICDKEEVSDIPAIAEPEEPFKTMGSLFSSISATKTEPSRKPEKTAFAGRERDRSRTFSTSNPLEILT
jgi:hypothetical protein